MIVWQGLGFLGLLIPIVTGFVTVVLANALLGQAYVATHAWPVGLGVLLGAGGVSLLSQKLDQPGRTLVDQATGQTVVLKRKHTLFWIPLNYLAVVIAAVGTFLLFVRPS